MLTVTNGDGAVAALSAAGIPGHIFPWRDVLHEGPVPADLSLPQLSRVRAGFIAGRGWGREDEVGRDFQKRDEKLETARHHDELILWFEHDLYDQLQLLQVLDQLAESPPEDTGISMICRDTFITHATAAQLREWFDQRARITAGQLDLGRRAWDAFRQPSPAAWAALLDQDTTELPYLAAAVERHLQEFPAPSDGLSRTERQILQALAEGHTTPRTLFRATMQMEDASFMGDHSFWLVLAGLASGEDPVVGARETFKYPPGVPVDDWFLQQPLEITTVGMEILAGKRDWIALHPIDKWLGGVHLTDSNRWRWDPRARQLLSS